MVYFSKKEMTCNSKTYGTITTHWGGSWSLLKRYRLTNILTHNNLQRMDNAAFSECNVH